MSATDDGDDGGPGSREVARRLFAAEFDDAEYSYSESDEERAPNYVVSPTGERINRLFAVGVLTEVSQAGDSILRARVADPTGAFVVYAGQYQPEAMAFLDRTEPPAFVALTGKARTFQPDDSEVVYSSVRPEEMNVVDRDTRDRWVVTTAERTLHRVGVIGTALDSGLTGEQLRSALVEAGVEGSLAAGVPIAIEQYGTTRAYLSALQELALDAARLVAGEIEEVGALSLGPADGDGAFTPAVNTGLELPAAAAGAATSAGSGATATTEAESQPTATSEGADSSFEPVEESEPTASGTGTGTETDTNTGAAAESGTPTGTGAGTDSGADADAGAGRDVPSDSPGDVGADATATDAETGAATGPDRTAETSGTGEEPAPDDAESTGAEDIEADLDGVEFDPDEEVIDEAAREEVEEEFGLEFETGSEVESGDAEGRPTESAGAKPEPEPELDVESESEPEPEFDPVEPEDDATDTTEDSAEPQFEPTGTEGSPEEPEPESEPDPAEEAAGTSEPDEGGANETADDRPLDEVLIDRMNALDDGSGAPREELITAVAETAGVDQAAVEAAIEDALMSGRCYEPDEGRYASI